MRNVFPPQMSIGQRDIADIQIDVSSRDDIPVILLGLQHIFTTQPLRDAVFKILEEVAPTKMDDEGTKIVSINKGRPGMDQWSILVLGSLRVGLNTDYDRILELANQHNTLRERGVAIFAKAFFGIPAQQAAKITRPLIPSAAPAVLLHSLHTQQGVCNIVTQ